MSSRETQFFWFLYIFFRISYKIDTSLVPVKRYFNNPNLLQGKIICISCTSVSISNFYDTIRQLYIFCFTILLCSLSTEGFPRCGGFGFGFFWGFGVGFFPIFQVLCLWMNKIFLGGGRGIKSYSMFTFFNFIDQMTNNNQIPMRTFTTDMQENKRKGNAWWHRKWNNLVGLKKKIIKKLNFLAVKTWQRSLGRKAVFRQGIWIE